jgi:hypothetical protein
LRTTVRVGSQRWDALRDDGSRSPVAIVLRSVSEFIATKPLAAVGGLLIVVFLAVCGHGSVVGAHMPTISGTLPTGCSDRRWRTRLAPTPTAATC